MQLDFEQAKKLLKEIKNNINTFEYNDGFRYRWYGFDSIIIYSNYIEVILKNCTYQYTPDVIDVITKTETPNTRTTDQGDKEKTHFLITKDYIVVEKKKNGSSISILKRFLNEALDTINDELDDVRRIEHSVIMVEDFIKIFEKCTRIKNVNITIDKSHELDEFTRFHSDQSVKDTYSLVYKAKRSKSISKDTIRYYLDKFISGNGIVEKITMDIDNEDSDAMKINSEHFAKHAYLDVPKDSSGVVISSDIFIEMKNL